MAETSRALDSGRQGDIMKQNLHSILRRFPPAFEEKTTHTQIYQNLKKQIFQFKFTLIELAVISFILLFNNLLNINFLRPRLHYKKYRH